MLALLLDVVAVGYFSALWARRRAGGAETATAARHAEDASATSFVIALVIVTGIVVPVLLVVFRVLRDGVI